MAGTGVDTGVETGAYEPGGSTPMPSSGTSRVPGRTTRGRRSLLVRVGGAALEAAAHAPASALAAATRSVEQVTAGRSSDVVSIVGSAGARFGADVLDIAVRHEVPGAVRASQGVEQARQWLQPVAALANLGSAGSSDPEQAADVAEGVELRAMGRELLHRSAGFASPGQEHPAFRTILTSMAPDEARIVRFLAEHDAQPTLDVVEFDRGARTARQLAYNVSFIGREAGCLRADLTPVYLDHLERMGVVTIRDYAVAPEAEYELLQAQPALSELPATKGLFTRRKLAHKGAELSDFGRTFFDVCFADADTDPSAVARAAATPGPGADPTL